MTKMQFSLQLVFVRTWISSRILLVLEIPVSNVLANKNSKMLKSETILFTTVQFWDPRIVLSNYQVSMRCFADNIICIIFQSKATSASAEGPLLPIYDTLKSFET